MLLAIFLGTSLGFKMQITAGVNVNVIPQKRRKQAILKGIDH